MVRTEASLRRRRRRAHRSSRISVNEPVAVGKVKSGGVILINPTHTLALLI